MIKKRSLIYILLAFSDQTTVTEILLSWLCLSVAPVVIIILLTDSFGRLNPNWCEVVVHNIYCNLFTSAFLGVTCPKIDSLIPILVQSPSTPSQIPFAESFNSI